MPRLATAVLLFLSLSACAGEETPDAPDGGTEAAVIDTAPMLVTGFSASEAVRHDPEADVYLVANINGGATDMDDNGFISRVSPDGEILDLRWIDGAEGDFTLNAPKGMALRGEHLLVADIDHVRLFNRSTGEHVADWVVPGAQFLNDVAVGDDGTVYTTDTQGAALYRFEGDTPVVMAFGEDFGAANGVDIGGDVMVVVFWGGGAKRIDRTTGQMTDLPAPEGARLDGVVLTDDGYFVSSWDAEAVLHVGTDGTITEVLGAVPEAADIGYDATRARLLVPTFSNELHIIPLGG